MSEVLIEDIQKKKRLKSAVYFTASLITALLLTWLLKQPGFTDSQMYTLFLLFFSIGLWVTEAIPAFAVSLFIMAYLVFAMGNEHFNAHPEKIDKYVNTFSSSTIWLFLGGFFISSAMTKTRLDEELLRLTLRISGTKPQNILIALMATTMIGSMLMSNTATTAMIVAALMPLLNSLGKSGTSKALLLGVSVAATTGGMATIIGSPPNAVAVGILENVGIKITFLDWMLYGLPLALALSVICGIVLMKAFIKDSSPVSFSFLGTDRGGRGTESVIKRHIVLVIIIVTIAFWFTTSWHGITVAAISAIPIVFLTLTGILDGDDIRALPWDTLFLVAGGLSLGVALESSGILNHFADFMKTLNAGTLIFLLIFAFLSSIFANFVTNAASSAVLIPIGMAILPGFEKEVALSIGLAASLALFLPVSTPWNAIVYSTGMLEQKDFRIGGILIGVLGPILTVLWILLLK
ncbi:MAG: SLC13 family permease [Cytophagaceae bacterium]